MRNRKLSSMGLGRLFSNLSTNNSSIFSIPRDKNLMRFDRDFFFGKYIDDDISKDEQLCQARQKVSKLLINKNNPQPNEFIQITSDIRKYLCNDDVLDEFKLPKNLMYFGDGSPYQKFLDKALLKCFRTSWNATHGHRENFSGWALAGARGTGKSTLTRLVALLSGLLLPNFQSAYVSAIDIPNLSLQEFITHAALQAKVITSDTSSSSAIGHFTRNKFAIGLFIDELTELYQENDVNWRYVHSIVSTTEPTFVLANGSSSILPAMVKKDIADFPLLRKYVKNPLSSLNGTKLMVEYQSKFSTKEHYLNYFDHLGYDFLKTPSNILINKVHIFSGGVLRLMSEDLKLFTENYSVLLEKHRTNYPGKHQLEYEIYTKLAEKFLRGVIPHQWDAFNLPTINENELLPMIRNYYNKQNININEYLILQQLVESDTLFVIKRGISNEYTYGCPAHFLITINKPIVFISHRWFDHNDISDTQNLLNDIVKNNKNAFFVYCEDPDAQEAIRQYGISTWYDSQVKLTNVKLPDTIKRAGIALINEQYLTRLEQGHDNGCAKEFESFLKQLSHQDSAPVIMLTSLSDIPTLINRLVACFPEYEQQIKSAPYYNYNDNSLEDHIEKVCNNSREKFTLDRQCFAVEE